MEYQTGDILKLKDMDTRVVCVGVIPVFKYITGEGEVGEDANINPENGLWSLETNKPKT